VFGEFPRLFPAARARWGVVEWRHGKRALDRVRLKDVLDRAGVRAGAVPGSLQRLGRTDRPDSPDFMKSLDIEHARDGDVMLACAMNGEQLPLLNGFPLRLIVPGLVFHLLGQDAERHRGARPA